MTREITHFKGHAHGVFTIGTFASLFSEPSPRSIDHRSCRQNMDQEASFHRHHLRKRTSHLGLWSFHTQITSCIQFQDQLPGRNNASTACAHNSDLISLNVSPTTDQVISPFDHYIKACFNPSRGSFTEGYLPGLVPMMRYRLP